MSRKWITVVAVMAAAGGGAVAATAVLGDGATLERPNVATLDVSVSGANGATAAGVGARTSGKTKFTYPSSGVQTVAGDVPVDVEITNCPRKSKVLNATYDTDIFDSAVVSSVPVGKRGWRLTLHRVQFNSDGEDYQAVFGLVCAQSKKKK